LFGFNAAGTTPSGFELLLMLVCAGAGAGLGWFLQPSRKEAGASEEFIASSFPGVDAWAKRAGQDLAKSFGKTARPNSLYVLSYAFDIILPVLIGLVFLFVISNARSSQRWGWYRGDELNPVVKFLQAYLPFLARYSDQVVMGLVYGLPVVCCFFFAN